MREQFIGKRVADFELQSSDGSVVKLSDLTGRKVLLYFFTGAGGKN